MKLKALVASIALAAAGSSMAATFGLGDVTAGQSVWFGNWFGKNQSFSDTFTFTLTGDSNTIGTIWDAEFLSRNDTTLTSVTLTGGGLSSTIVDTTPADFSFSNLMAGTYNLIVNGTVSGHNLGLYEGAGYAGRMDVAAAVPEPEAIAMLALGLGAVGFAARRRKNQSK
ncbi:FxDxF family PEP-CTERM protein [Rhizobacter sp. LjRoot28]|jgi:hypothetical protein